MKCPVCGIETNNIKCPDCNFDKFQTEFLNNTEYANWIFNSVIPHRDCYVNSLHKKSIEQIECAKRLIRDKRNNKIWLEGQECECDIALDKARKYLEKIDLLHVYWIIKSVVKIEYTEHMGYFGYPDNITYTFDFSKEFLKIEYERDNSEQRKLGTYDDLEINSVEFLKKIFKDHKLLELKHSKDEDYYWDGASWDIKVHLTYPIVYKAFEKESYWRYFERNNSNLSDHIERWRWNNVKEDYLLECGGQFNQAYHLLANAIGEPIKEPPKNLEIIKHDEKDICDLW